MSTSPQCSQCKSAVPESVLCCVRHRSPCITRCHWGWLSAPWYVPAQQMCHAEALWSALVRQTCTLDAVTCVSLLFVSCQHLAQVVVCSLKADHLPRAHFHMIIQNCVLHSLFHFLREDMDTKEVNFIV